MSREQLDKFLRLLKASPSGAVFNPWWQIDDENDIGPNCPAIRRKHLTVYFRERLGKARLAIVGEALGYRGGHFSGIPMTSERMLLGKKPEIVAALSKRRSTEHPGRWRSQTAATDYCRHKAAPHEQANRLPGWFFGTDGDNRLGGVAEDWHADRMSSSCGMRFRGIHSIRTADG